MKTNRPLLLFAIMALLLPISASAAVTVENVTAKQRYPWNGKVDVSYTIVGDAADLELIDSIKISAKDCDTGISYVATSLFGDVSMVSGTHAVIWDAQADLGEVRYTNMIVSVNVRATGQLWENGPVWAETNIGAENPWDYGYYFWWGDTVGYKREGDAWVASDGSSQSFSFSSDNTPTYGKNNDALLSEGWITADGVLAPTHDAAQAHWGGSWRMPTDAELSALRSNCDWTWTTTNGVSGYVVRGRDDFEDASIFLPVTGRGNRTSLSLAGTYGDYWSSVPYSSYSGDAECLDFNSGYRMTLDRSRDYGFSVRPVQGFAE